MNFIFKQCLLCCSILFATFSLVAQETYPDTLTYSLGIDVSGARSTGIFSRTSFRVGVHLHLTHGRLEFNNDLSYQFNNTNGLKLLDDWRNVTSLQYHLGGAWNWFPIVLHLYENNIIYRVDRRNQLGVGIGGYPLDKNGYQIRFTTGYFYENETYNGDTFINSELIDPQRINNNVWLHLTTKIPIAKRGSFNIDFWYFQSFKESEDYALSILPKLQMKINEHFSFMVRYDWRFENVFLEPLVDTNDLLLFGLNVKFGN